MPKRTTAWGRMTKSLVFGGLAAIVFFLLFSLSSAPGQGWCDEWWRDPQHGTTTI